MKIRTLWLSFLFTSTLAVEQGNPVRVRGATSPFFNASKSIDSSTTFITTTTNVNRVTTTESRDPPDTNTRNSADTQTETRGPPDDSDRDAITHSTSCINSVETLTDSILETVYVTVDGSYEVRVPASNVSLVAPTIYETPLQACTTTIVSKKSSTQPPQPFSSEIHSFLVPTVTRPSPGAFAKQTSTIVVTKKTPVPIVDPTDQGPPVTFPTANPDTGSGKATPQQNLGTSDSGNNGPPNNNNPVTTPPGRNDANPTGNGNNGSNQIPRVTPTINGVPVTVGPSVVVIGSQTVALPTSSQAVVVAGSQTFIIRPSEIVGAGTTYQIGNQLAGPATITQAPSVVVSAGVTATIGASVAIISGTTYRIGTGASPTTLVVNGQTIAIGSDGVAFSGPTPTTYAPAMTIASGYQIVVMNGLTVSIDQNVAVISGTTYRIGAGATLTTVNMGGTTITIGPSGVVFPSTTIKPTAIPTVTSPSIAQSASTTQATSSSGSGPRLSGFRSLPFNLSRFFTWIVALSPLYFL